MEQEDRTQRGVPGWVKGVGIAALVIGGAWACGSNLSSGGTDDPETMKYAARAQCEEWVRERLRAPSTAEFSNQNVTGGPASWTVSGAVDAQNGFGAMIRNTWTCDIRLDGDMWRGSVSIND